MKTAAASALFLGQSLAQDAGQQIIALLSGDNVGLTTLATALGDQPDIVSTLVGDTDGFTVFGPANDPLGQAANGLDAAALAPILQYHVSLDPFDASNLPAVVETALGSDGLSTNQVFIVSQDGDNVVIQSGSNTTATVTNTVAADPNIIHILDAVLTPPDTVDNVATTNGLTSLVSALSDADLVDTVLQAQDITVFAPTNDAFTAVGDTSDLDMSSILQYHVVTGVNYSVGLQSATLSTLQGTTIELVVNDDGSVVLNPDSDGNGVNVTATDVLTANGVVHVIDAVLVPSDDGTANPVNPSAAGALSASFAFIGMVAALFL